MDVKEQFKKIDHGIKHMVVNRPDLMSYQAAAKYIGCAYSTIRKKVSDGTFSPIRSGGFRYLRKSDLDLFMEGKLKNGKQQHTRAGNDKSSSHGRGKAAFG